MRYQVGRTGRVVVARLEDREDVLASIAKIAKDEGIRSAAVYLVGGMRKGRLVVGPEADVMPPVPIWREMGESHEVTAVGTMFYEGDEPRVHLHGAFGKRDDVKMGCLRGESETFLVLEAVMIEIEGITAVREKDPVSGLTLLKL